MTLQRTSPSPLAGEGAEREKREAGEGARSLTKAARRLRSQLTDAERKLWFAAGFSCSSFGVRYQLDLTWLTFSASDRVWWWKWMVASTPIPDEIQSATDGSPKTVFG
jgi:hypothetical protein